MNYYITSHIICILVVGQVIDFVQSHLVLIMLKCTYHKILSFFNLEFKITKKHDGTLPFSILHSANKWQTNQQIKHNRKSAQRKVAWEGKINNVRRKKIDWGFTINFNLARLERNMGQACIPANIKEYNPLTKQYLL